MIFVGRFNLNLLFYDIIITIVRTIIMTTISPSLSLQCLCIFIINIYYTLRTPYFLGISQRDCSTYYEYLGNDLEGYKSGLEEAMVEFWEEKVAGKFQMDRCEFFVYLFYGLYLVSLHSISNLLHIRSIYTVDILKL
jgi:D123